VKHPIEVTVDPECAVGYVRYRADERLDGSRGLRRDRSGSVRRYDIFDFKYESSGVIIDVNLDDEIIGFEILDADDPIEVAIARDYAADNGLAFPADLRAAAAASRTPAA
jgi:hypothetical protein